MLENLPAELLRETIGHIHQPSHLKTLCLVSKTVSSIATQFLYRNLVLDNLNEECAQKEMRDVVKADGLRFVKTLKVGPIEGKMVTLFDHLIFKLQDHSLTNFEWDEYGPPFNSQLVYIWDHQRNIQSIDLDDWILSDAVGAICPRKGLKFPQKYVHISLDWPSEENFLERLDLSFMRELTVRWTFWHKLPSCFFANLIQITNLQLHWIRLFDSELELDRFSSLLSLGFYRCQGASSILSKFKNPKLKDFRYEPDWDELPELQDEMFDEDLEEQFALLRKFQGLETLVIEAPDQRHPASCLKNLKDSILLEHNKTLRSLTFLDACKSEDGDNYTHNTTNSRCSVFDAIIACTHLIQLELLTEWKTKETDFKRIVDNLSSLKILCLQIVVPWDSLPGYYHEKKSPFGKTMLPLARSTIPQSAASLIRSITDNSSNLRLLTFQIRGYKSRLCFTRNWPHSKGLLDGFDQISEHLVKYHMPEYELLPPYTPVDISSVWHYR